MTGPRVLREGGSHRLRQVRARRRRRIRRLAGALAAAIVLGLIVLLVFMTSGTASGPGTNIVSRPPGKTQTKPPTRSAVPHTYGLLPAPHMVRARFKLKLRSGLLFDVKTGRVLWERDPTLVLPIASLTKMMTALLVATRTRLGARVLITPQAVHFSGSGVGLLPLGKRVPALPLLYGLLLPSGNDAAIALAQHVAGTQRRFVAMMNSTARAMGLTCTHFSSVSGIVDQGNQSCAGDLALLAHHLLEHPLLARIVATRSASLPFPIRGGRLYLYNNNPLLIMGYPGTDGVKTGYTVAAGQCLVATARRGRRWLGVVLLHSQDPADQAERLLDQGFTIRGV
ncbi:MAG: hypothetical protein LC685_00310 [Actinobacteria bacterium]|nr:hypothetical protein [Actinomycetota bacterium]